MPKIKKKQQSSSSESDSGPEDVSQLQVSSKLTLTQEQLQRNQPASKKAKETPAVEGKKSGSGDSGGGGPWVLEKLRQVRINEFRGRKMVDIREHYEKNGEILPGKKGISLSIQQWKQLLEMADEITRAVEN